MKVADLERGSTFCQPLLLLLMGVCLLRRPMMQLLGHLFYLVRLQVSTLLRSLNLVFQSSKVSSERVIF